jgi:hypothetical protein
MWNEWRGETSLLGGELALPVWVARVSRFIGKFDTTAKRPGWQVNFGVTGNREPAPSPKNPPDAQNATP